MQPIGNSERQRICSKTAVEEMCQRRIAQFLRTQLFSCSGFISEVTVCTTKQSQLGERCAKICWGFTTKTSAPDHVFPQSLPLTRCRARSKGTSALESFIQHLESFQQVRLNLKHNIARNFKNPQDIPVLILKSLRFLPECQLSLFTMFSSW